MPANIWTDLEAEYQLTRARHEAETQIDREAEQVMHFPYPEMAKLGRAKPTRKRSEKVIELRKFFGVAALANIQGVRAYAPAFRQA